MPRRPPSRRAPWLLCLAIIIPLGILSRIIRTGHVVFDKYLGDFLYAAMIYAILRLWCSARTTAISAAAVMLAIELFQLTLIPARLLASEHLLVRVIARLLGTHFGWLDLLAYFVAIAFMYTIDHSRRR